MLFRNFGVAPTLKQDGFKEYYKCECGRYFEDKECKTEIDDLEAWKAKGGRGYLPKLKKASPETSDRDFLIFWCIIAIESMLLLVLMLRKRRKEAV